jgi:hypothetical protein
MWLVVSKEMKPQRRKERKGRSKKIMILAGATNH